MRDGKSHPMTPADRASVHLLHRNGRGPSRSLRGAMVAGADALGSAVRTENDAALFTGQSAAMVHQEAA